MRLASLRFLAAVGLLTLAGCATPSLQQLKDPKTGQLLPDQFEGKKTAETQFRALATPAVLVGVHSATQPGFDRVGFTFSGKNVPAYHLLYSKESSSQGAQFEMRFGARVNLAKTKPGVSKFEPQQSLNYPVIKNVWQEKIGEEYVIWRARLSKITAYRATELSNPPRLILDFKH